MANIIKTSYKFFMKLKWFARIGVLLVIVVPPFMYVTIHATGTPQFCNSCHIMNPYYDNWKTSSHNDVSCLNCHIPPGVINYAKGKITGLAQAVDCIVGRVGTKPNGTVVDESCLREGCHEIKELEKINVDFNGVKFTHKGHVDTEVGGIEMNCGTCHSHYEGGEHFSVNKETCFTCHFLRDEGTNKKLAQASCQDCHDVPDKIIQRGPVSVNHAEFVSYEANCEDSCHKRQVEKISNVEDKICLNCHIFTKSEEHLTAEELHKVHTEAEKVECFACHGKVEHGPSDTENKFSVASMISCEGCHSDTHGIQKSIFTADHHPTSKDDNKILSPMFLTHVQCTGCHVEQSEVKTAAIDSFGTVLKAAPWACDKCHEKGTGDRYIPFWQNGIKKQYKKVNDRLGKLDTKLNKTEGKSYEKAVEENVKQVKAILESIQADGSWGVHNLKYTEAMLRNANDIITESNNMMRD